MGLAERWAAAADAWVNDSITKRGHAAELTPNEEAALRSLVERSAIGRPPRGQFVAPLKGQRALLTALWRKGCAHRGGDAYGAVTYCVNGGGYRWVMDRPALGTEAEVTQ